ncbi:conserved hypothetical protein [Ricinus communis]|uniref:CUE domain-containing protein n=1 Tax=Ricinus communis TaxID=3988 RepID=B9T4A3_RICCO|nr:conserved hypothetical protein [Ricinus communis]
MGFKTVYRSLGELFPQVDSRILKAVAIEHPKDADVAADVVISEVLPFLATIVDSPPVNSDRKPSGLSAGRGDSLESNSIDKACTCKTDLGSSGHPSGSTHQEKSENSTAPVSVDLNADTNQLEGCIESEELILLVRPQHQDNVQSVTSQTSELVSSALPCEEITDSIQVCGTMETKVPASLGKCQDDNITVGGKQYFQVISTSLTQENGDFTGDQGEWKGSDGPLPDDFDTSGKISQVVSCVDGGKSPRVEPCVDGTDLEVDNSLVERTPNAAEVDFQSELSGTPTNSCKNLKFNQDIKIDFLEDIVEAARHNKRTLFLSMESIMNMMRKVELQEKAAEDAKEEASSAGLDILTKANELKQMLEHAKDANDMHAGEVYGERAILATEVRELQARLLSLSDERDKALAIIDEMHQSLEERLAAAEELKKAAEKQKLEQEEAARNALAEQEAIMGQVVQESKIIQQEADENSKLREFLMDRGRVVDTLQGEISVICQDVRLLKERFDERIPLSKSISSSQTSCILASSGSSIRSIATDLVPEPRETSKSLKDRSLTPSSIDGRSPTSPTTSSFIDGRSPKSGLKEERTNGEVASDDDWEIFE